MKKISLSSLVLLLYWIPFFLCAQNAPLQAQLEQAVRGKRADIGIAVIIDGKDTVTVNNNRRYPLMSVVKFHQALALADHMARKKQSLETRLPIRKSDLKPDTYSPLRDKYPQGGFEMSVAELLAYTLQLSDNNACDILFQYQGGPKAVNDYMHSLGIRDCSIAVTENTMHLDLDQCYRNWSTPLAAAKLVELFCRDSLFADEYKTFIYQTMVQCQTGQDRLAAPLLNKGITIGHKTGTGDRNAQGRQIGCNDIGFVFLPSNHSYCIAVFVKDSQENDRTNAQIIADISRLVYEYVVTLD